MKRKGGIRDRLGLNPAEPKAAAGASSSAGAPASSSGEAMPIRGGIRRRLESRAIAAGERPKDETPFTDSLKQRWAEGKLSSPLVQEFAMKAGQQGAHSLDRLGQAGKSGLNPQHLQTALMNFFGRPEGSPIFTWVPVPLKFGKTVKDTPHPVLLPHHYFQSLHSARPDL